MSQVLSEQDVRDAGGIVHRDGNVFFTNIDKLNAAILAKLADRLNDADRLDHIQTTGSTVHLIPAGVDAEENMVFAFCVGGLHASVGMNIREAIDAAIDAQKGLE